MVKESVFRERSVKRPTTLVAALVIIAACGPNERESGARGDSASLSAEEVKAVAEEAYVFAFPILEQYKMLFALALYEDSGAFAAPLNALSYSTELLGPESTIIVRPNNDTLYSGCSLSHFRNYSCYDTRDRVGLYGF